MRKILHAALLLSIVEAIAPAADRPPAVPLIAYDPYFSVWSMAGKLADQNTKHWTGVEQPLIGLLRIDGATYRYMGLGNRQSRALPAMEQTSLSVTATHTAYTFTAAGVRLVLTFFTPAIPENIGLLSRPVTYLRWQLNSTDGKEHQTAIYLDCDPLLAVDTRDQQVTWGRAALGNLTVLSVGSRDQRELERFGDNVRIDWGYFHLAAPDGQSVSLVNSSRALDFFLLSGSLPTSDDLDMPVPARDGAHLAVEFPAVVGTSAAVTRHVLLSYTEQNSIEYLGQKLRPFWQRKGETVAEMLQTAEAQYAQIEVSGQAFDSELQADLERVGGRDYAKIATLAFRQTLAANGLAADINGTPMMFPKENFSNGCIATVDVLYPAAPFFLFFNPDLLEAQLEPVLRYAALPRWKWPFAPHDLGTYPLADGQVYGGGERTEENQMPVEESGNMLLLIAALGQKQSNWHLARTYWPQLTKWAEYLKEKGLDPSNQLSTDDFAGHLAHNANLSIKAIEGLAAYAEMARGLGKQDAAAEYSQLSRDMAAKWEQLAIDGDHYKLAFDKPGTWSQKYNLVWDQILDLKLFPARVRETELKFYRQHINRYGLPLDNRADYTKLDWELWTATLAGDSEGFQTLVAPIGKWIDETPSRVPLTDWYDTVDGKQKGFQARSVVGGVYIKALADGKLAKKWASRPFP